MTQKLQKTENNQYNMPCIKDTPIFLLYILMVKYDAKCLWHLPQAKGGLQGRAGGEALVVLVED